MADRPGDGSPDGPDYGWLYGGQPPPPTQPVQQPTPGAPPPDATRAIPVQPRPTDTSPRPVQPRPPLPPVTARVPPRLAPTPLDGPRGPIAPGTTYGTPRSRPRRPRLPRLLRPRLRWVLLIVPLWIAYLVVVPIVSWQSVHKVGWEPSGKRPAEQNGTTYLLVGSDSRAGLSEKERRKLGTGDAAGARTDTILLLHTGSGPNLLLSIPRDTVVDIPGHGSSKINAAFAYGGAKLLVRTIEDFTGIRVDQYGEIGLGGLVNVVDAVGGVQICPRMRMNDPLANLHVKKGCQQADGPTALAYARSRHVSALGDIDRARRQREVIAAIGHKVASPWSVINPFRYWKLNHAMPDSIAFGKGAGPLRALEFASAMTKVNGSKGLTCSLPLKPVESLSDVDPVRSKELFAKIAADDTKDIGKTLCSPTGIVKS